MHRTIDREAMDQGNGWRIAASLYALNSTDELDRESRDVFLLDSGAPDHIVQCKDWLGDLLAIAPRRIILGNGQRLFATHKGTLILRTTLKASGDQYETTVVLFDVLFVPELHTNLISFSKLCEDRYQINFGRDRCNGMHEGLTKFEGVRHQGVYRMKSTSFPP